MLKRKVWQPPFLFIFFFLLLGTAKGQEKKDEGGRGAYRFRYYGAKGLEQAGQGDGEKTTLSRLEWKELDLNPDGKKTSKKKKEHFSTKRHFIFEEKHPHGKINKKLLRENKHYLRQFDSFYDEKMDYRKFYGRVSDRDASSHIIKIATENKNIKFFRAGDKILFTVASVRLSKCTGFVRTVEQKHFVIYVKNVYPCWRKNDYFRRGTQLNFFSEDLARRVRRGAEFRSVLLLRKRDFYRQLNNANHFVWSYNQKKVQVGSDFDRKINALKRQKQKAMDILVIKNRDQIRLQRELSGRLDEIDRELDYFKIDPMEKLIDRWNRDQDLGLPVSGRPQKLKTSGVNGRDKLPIR